jgi:hypothetical protein
VTDRRDPERDHREGRGLVISWEQSGSLRNHCSLDVFGIIPSSSE